MAIYHLSAKIIRRSAGRSSVAAAAYRSASRLSDQRLGLDYDYTRKGGVEHSEILAPKNAPNWMRDRATLWNTVERVEKRRDAQLSREIELALPRELSLDRRVGLVREFIQSEFVDCGMVADCNHHAGKARDGGEQPHVHVMLSTRELMGDGFGPKNREWNSVDKLEGWRARWADHVNLELERSGHDTRVDHRTLEAQRAEAGHQAEHARNAGDTRAAEQHEDRAAALDREPEPKVGPTASNMEKLGHASRLGDERREVQARNAERRTMREQAHKAVKRAEEFARRMIEEAQCRLRDLGQRLEAAYRVVRERSGTLTRPAALEPELPPTLAEDPVTSVATAARDALLGRTRPGALNPARDVASDALLKPAREIEENARPNVEALLGRGLSKPPQRTGHSRDDDERGP